MHGEDASRVSCGKFENVAGKDEKKEGSCGRNMKEDTFNLKRGIEAVLKMTLSSLGKEQLFMVNCHGRSSRGRGKITALFSVSSAALSPP